MQKKRRQKRGSKSHKNYLSMLGGTSSDLQKLITGINED